MSTQPSQASSATLVPPTEDGTLSSREALILAQAVWEDGADAWATVARVLSKHPLISRPPAFFTPQACQSMYLNLMKQANLDCVERNKTIHAPLNLKLAQKHFKVRVQELSDEIALEESKFKEILTEIEEIQSGQWDHKIQSTFNEPPRSPSVHRSTRSQEGSDEEPQEQDRPVTPLRYPATPTARSSAEADVRIKGEMLKVTPKGEVSEGSDLSVATDVVSPVAVGNSPLLVLTSIQTGEKRDEPVNDIPNQDNTTLREVHNQPTNSFETRSAPSSPAPMNVDQQDDIRGLEQSAQQSIASLIPLPDTRSAGIADTTPATVQTGIIPLETELEHLPSPADEQTPQTEPQEALSAIEAEKPASVKEEGTVTTRGEIEVTQLKGDHGQDKESAEDEGDTSGEEPPPITRRTTRASAAASASKRKPRRTKESSTALEISLPETGTTVVEESDSQTPSLKIEEADQISSPAPHEHLRKREGKRKASFVDGVDSPRDRKRTRDDSEPVDEEEPGPATTAPRSRRRGDRTEEQMALRRFQNVITMLHSQISQHRNGNIFHNPIKNSEAPDYHEIVKRPMDLKTIKTRVKDGAIANSLEYQRDIFLMFANAMMYNRPGSGVYLMAEDMMVESEGYINSFRQTEGLVQRAQRM